MYDSLPACFSLWECIYTTTCARVERGKEFASNGIMAFVPSRLRKGCTESSIESEGFNNKGKEV
jgi:hypothetical protein